MRDFLLLLIMTQLMAISCGLHSLGNTVGSAGADIARAVRSCR